MSKQEMNLDKLEQMAIEMMNQTNKGSNSMNNKTILYELLSKGSYNRAEAPIRAATLWFEKTKVVPTSHDYTEKIISIKNSLDTMVSNYNNDDKINRDKLLSGTTLVNDNGVLHIEK